MRTEVYIDHDDLRRSHCRNRGASLSSGLIASGISGVVTGALSAGRESTSSKHRSSGRCSDDPIFCGDHAEHEEWSYKVRILLNSEGPLFATFFTYLEELDHQVMDSQQIKIFRGQSAEIGSSSCAVSCRRTQWKPLTNREEHGRGSGVLRCWSLDQSVTSLHNEIVQCGCASVSAS